MAMTPEGKVKAAIKRKLIEHGIWFYMPIQNGMGVTGIPDFICCWDGRFLAIEAKAPGKRANLSANQERVIAMIGVAGGIAMVIDDAVMLGYFLASYDEPSEYVPQTE
jgi:hypothetical protein